MTEPSRTKAELSERAAELNIDGRSSMTRDELEVAVIGAEAQVAAAEAESPVPDAAELEPDVVEEDVAVEPGPSARGPLVEVAQKRAKTAHVRVIGAETPEQEA